MHENRRYVKLRRIWVGLACALLWAPVAKAELVTAAQGPAALTVGRDGLPRVAYAEGCVLHVAVRSAAGWHDETAASCLPLAANALVVDGIAVDGHGRTSVLVQDETGTAILLVRTAAAGWRTDLLARAGNAGAVLGSAGLTLDARGLPVVAYALRRASHATFLRLVRIGARGGFVTTAITRGGFPASDAPPAAVPVLVRGRIHVVEAFGSQGIAWEPAGRTWSGQYLFANTAGLNGGPVFATAFRGATWTASTLLEPQFGESDVLLTLENASENTTIVFPHARVAALTLVDGRPEVAANDEVDIADTVDVAALVGDEEGNSAELDGAIEGYTAAVNGVRHILLRTQSGLEWFASPTRPSVQVMLDADATGHLRGRVGGVPGGTVELYREQPYAGRVLVGTVPLAADGSFAAQDTPPTSPTLYRAVYRDPLTGLPYSSLTRTPLG